MKKILSIFALALMLFTMFSFMAAAEDDLFDVAFIEESNIFVVTAGKGMVGSNNVALLVRDSAGEVVYMDTANGIRPNYVYFAVNLGGNLSDETYTFTVSSDGDTVASQTKTCSSADNGGSSGINPIYDDPNPFYDVSYDAEANAFTVTGEITKENGDPAFNRIALLVYEPSYNGANELCYMDALNEHTGPFTFTVPLSPMAPAGTYTFIVTSDGDVIKDSIKSYGMNDNFKTHGTIDKGSTIRASYTLADGETAPMVIIAVYKNGSLAFIETAETAVNGKITAEVSFGADEDTEGYTAKAFVWENFETLRPIKSARFFG